MSFPELFEPGISLYILRSLAHFLWEAALLAVIAAVGLRLLKYVSSTYRYAMLVLLMVAMPVCAAVTCFMVSRPLRAPAIAIVPVAAKEAAFAANAQTPRTHRSVRSMAAAVDHLDAPGVESDARFSSDSQVLEAQTPRSAVAPEVLRGGLPALKPKVKAAHPAKWASRVVPGIVALYCCGVALMLIRLCAGIFRSAALRGESRPVAIASLTTAYDRQLQLSGVRIIPALLFCEKVIAPAVVGILKPAILLPVSICGDLSIDQVELLLAHELAHIRRHDQLVDLVQRMIEALFFFHPAVWYVSWAIRLEREKCCDDTVVRNGDSRLSYAETLVRVAELSSRAAAFGRPFIVGQSAGGRPSQLQLRILRLVGLAGSQEIFPSRSALLAAIACTLGGALFGVHMLTAARAQVPAVAAATQSVPYRVVYDNGVTVEIVAVSIPPSRGKPFWDPAGVRLVDTPYESREGGYEHAGDKKAVYEVIAQVTGTKDEPLYNKSRAADGISIGYGATPYNGATPVDGIRVFDCEVPAGAEALDFELGIAANKWQVVRTFKDDGTYGQWPDRMVVAKSGPNRPSTSTVQFTVKFAPREEAMRLVAIDAAGETHISKGGLLMGREDYTLEADFPNLPREKVREYRVESGAYEWKSFNSIHLSPPGGSNVVMARNRSARLMGQELQFKLADVARIDEAIEKIVRLRVFEDTDVWVSAIRDLSDIGPPAVPAIVAEIQNTSRPYARSGLAIALRAIGDPRAVPGLIESLATCPFAPNDYGGGRTQDPSLARFMLSLQTDRGFRSPTGPTFDLGRPVNEIIRTLEWITSHSEGYEPSKKNERAIFEEAAKRWRTWWGANKAPFLDGLPTVRIAANSSQKSLAPALPDPQRLAADLKANPKLAEQPMLDQWTLLHLAIVDGKGALVHALVEGGANVNVIGDGGWTPLHLAAALGRVELVQYLLDHKADATRKLNDGSTPLHAAVSQCDAPFYTPMPGPNLAIVKLLVDQGADVKAIDAQGRTALYGAATGVDAAVVKLLIERGSNVGAKDSRGRTALHRAVECNREETVDLLLAAGADVNAKDSGGLTPMRLSPYSLAYTSFNSPVIKKLLDHGAQVSLNAAIALGSAEKVAAAIKENPAAVNEQPKTSDERSPLVWAISRKSPELVKMLLDAGADPLIKDKTGNPPITSAVFSGNSQIVAMLLAAKADVNIQGQGDCLPLYWACTRLNTEIVGQLLAAGAKPIGANPDAPNPLSAALQASRENNAQVPGTTQEKVARAKAIVSALLAHGADVNQRVQGRTAIYGADNAELAALLFEHGAKLDVADDEGDSPLHIAAIFSRLELCRFLLAHRVPLEVKNKKGETPLHSAVDYFEPKGDVLKQLFAAGVDLSARDASGKSPLHRAVQMGSAKSVTALLDKGADVHARDNDGATPMHIAARLGRDALIVVLANKDGAIDARDSAGLTPLQWATKQKTRELLMEHGASPATAPSR